MVPAKIQEAVKSPVTGEKFLEQSFNWHWKKSSGVDGHRTITCDATAERNNAVSTKIVLYSLDSKYLEITVIAMSLKKRLSVALEVLTVNI